MAAVTLLATVVTATQSLVALAQPVVGQEGALRAYPLLHVSPADLAEQVQEILGERPDAEVRAEPDQSRLLVRGGDEVHRIVRQLISLLDVPGRPAAADEARQAPQPLAGSTPELRHYPLTAASRATLQQYQSHFAGRGDVRIAFDERTAQALVVAPVEIHDQLQQSLKQAPQTTVAPEINVVQGERFDAPPGTAARPQSQTQAIERGRLTTLTAEDLHKRLERALRRPLPATRDTSSQWLRFPLDVGPQGTSLAVHRENRQYVIEGPARRAAAWRRVVEALNDAPAGGQTVTRLIATEPQSGVQVRQVLHMLQTTGQDTGDAQSQPADPEAQGLSNQEVVGLLSGQGESIFGELLGPVDITYIEGLDIILIRGRPEDVERVNRIIEEIQRATLIAPPIVRVVPLEHVDSLAMSTLLNRLYTDVLESRVGSVHITPLGKPNALLLIGTEENVETAVELIDKLDQPVEPNTRFRVFPLRHAAVVDVLPLVEQLLAQPEQQDDEALPNLLPTGRVVADFRTNSLIVTASPRDLAEVQALINRVDTPGSETRDLIRIFQLRNTLATELAEVLRGAMQTQGATADEAADDGATAMSSRSTALELVTVDDDQQVIRSGILSGVRITADQRTNSLVVSASPESMSLVEALIRQLDRAPQVEANIKVFDLKEGDATSVAATLQELFGTTADADAVGGFGAGENALVRLQVSVDRRTNSIIAVGTRDDLEVVQALLFQLDTGDVSDRVNKVYDLKNAQAEAVAVTLQLWIDQRREAEQAVDLGFSPSEQFAREVFVVPEAASNSLVVSASPRYIKEVLEIIRQLDEEPPMVVVQVLIAEVVLGDTDEFGVELGLQDSLLFDRSTIATTEFQTIDTSVQMMGAGGAVTNTNTQTIVNAPLTPGFNFNGSPQSSLGSNGSAQSLATASKVAAQGLSNFALNRVNSDLGFSGLVLSASSDAVSALLRALQQKQRLEVLSRPEISVLDGQQGLVQVGQDVPTIQAVSLTDFGQTNSIVYRQVGLILIVQPRISPDGLVVMNIHAEKSRVSDAEGVPVSIVDGQPVLAPQIDVNLAETTVSAASGQTIILGGLIEKETFDVHRRVPIIADIPLFGDMFRYDLVDERRKELLIIMTPRVIRSKFESDLLKMEESSRMSWVLGDVIDIYGDVGLRSRCDEWYEGECESIYPQYYPNGEELVPSSEAEIPLEPVMPPGEPLLESTLHGQPELLDTAARYVDANVEPTAFVEPARSQPNRLPPTN